MKPSQQAVNNDMIDALVESINEHYSKQEYQLVWELIEDYLQELPGCAMLWLWRATLLQMYDDVPGDPPLAEVEECLWRAATLAPGTVEPGIELGHYYNAIEDDAEEGLRCFQEAEERAEKWLFEAYSGIIKCAEELGDSKVVARTKKKMYALWPNLAEYD